MIKLLQGAPSLLSPLCDVNKLFSEKHSVTVLEYNYIYLFVFHSIIYMSLVFINFEYFTATVFVSKEMHKNISDVFCRSAQLHSTGAEALSILWFLCM